uniref:Nucleolar protein 58-like n=1 Tax=Petromyzon marinus TaxID=7757 RepID=A0AAJ7XHQ2_PETMA|nr:nucleolar protein 58-like [Petromyzon marinus]
MGERCVTRPRPYGLTSRVTCRKRGRGYYSDGSETSPHASRGSRSSQPRSFTSAAAVVVFDVVLVVVIINNNAEGWKMNGQTKFLIYLFVGAIVMAVAGDCMVVVEQRGLHPRVKRARNRIQTALKRGVATFKKILLIAVLCVVIFISLTLFYNYGGTVRGALWASEAAPVLVESVRSDPLAWVNAADGFEAGADASVRGLVQAAADAVGDPRLAKLSDKLYGRDSEDPWEGDAGSEASRSSEPRMEILVGTRSQPRQKKRKKMEREEEEEEKLEGKEKRKRKEKQEKQKRKEKQEEKQKRKQGKEKRKRKQEEKQREMMNMHEDEDVT